MTQYTRLPSEEPEVPAYDADDRTAGSSRINTDNANNDDKTDNENQFVALPPPYGDNSDLPTYEEVERIKRDEEDRDSENPYSALLNGSMTANLFSSEMEVGSDSIFLLTFLIALMFSWVGFMLTFCVSNSMAGRYGAISGFGLSLIKWTVLISHSQYNNPAATATAAGTPEDVPNYWFNAWVSWLLILSGGMIFVKGIYMYVKAKQTAYENSTQMRNQTTEDDNNSTEEEQQRHSRQFSLFYFY